MNLSESLIRSVTGDASKEKVESGTFAVTRGSGVVGAAFVAAANFTSFGDDLTTDQRFWLTLAVGLAWVVLAAVDVASRAYVWAHKPADAPANAVPAPPPHETIAVPAGSEVIVIEGHGGEGARVHRIPANGRSGSDAVTEEAA